MGGAKPAMASWVNPATFELGNHIDWAHPIGMVDPDAIPVVPNCLDPIQVDVVQSGVTGGVATLGVGWDYGCTLRPWKGQLYEAIVTVPYVVTCGNGVRYSGWSRWNPTTFFTQGCGETGRDATWYFHSYPQGDVYVDELNRVRNMYWRDGEIGFGRGGVGPIIFDVEQLKDDALRGASVTLPPYTGGPKRLDRPLIFVHGLDVPYDETWGVRAPKCTPVTTSIVPEPGKTPKANILTQSIGLNGFQFDFQVAQAFLGTCQETSNPSVWESGWKTMFSLQVSPPLGEVDAETWSTFMRTLPPVFEGLHITGSDFEGSVLLWVPVDYLTRPALDNRYAFDPVPLGTKIIGGATIALVRLRFDVPMSAIEWDHASLAKHLSGRWGQVDQVAGSEDPYESGTAPDAISRLKLLKKGDQINWNGIYFFNGYRWSVDSGKMIQPLPWWNDAGETFPGQRGESWELYQFLSDVLTAHYGTAWTTDASLTVDLVVHSQGGITLREMLRNATGTDAQGVALPTGAANPANHIRRVVTVNTPHFGSVTTSDISALPTEYMSSHGRILQDSTRTDITLVDATITPTALGRALGGVAGGYAVTKEVEGLMYSVGDGTGDWRETAGDVLATVTAPIWIPLSLFVGETAGATMDERIKIQGHWLKLNSMYVAGVWPGGIEKKLGRFDLDEDIAYSRLFDGRKKGAHLGLESSPIQLLANAYPKLPDGRDLDLQTMHSTIGGVVDVIRVVLARTLGDACTQVDQEGQATCRGFANVFKYGDVVDALVSNVDVEMPIMPFLDEYQKGYMSLTDGAVGGQSQKAVRSDNVWDPSLHPDKFQVPRSYDLRRFYTRGRFPDSLVPHGDLGKTFGEDLLGRLANPARIVGAPKLGHDIYCALASDCRDLWELGGAPARMPESGSRLALRNGPDAQTEFSYYDTLSVSGDFRFGVLPEGADFQGYVVTHPGGGFQVEVRSSPDVGLTILRRSNLLGETFWYRAVPKGYVVRPVLVREGNQLRIEVTTWKDQKITETISTSVDLPDTLVLGVIVADKDAPKPVLIGRGAIDTSLRDPKSGPEARVWFREQRGSDTRYSRPLILVENTGKDTLRGVDLRYVFRADPNHPPVLEAPTGTPWSVRSLGGDLWELAYSNPTLLIPPGNVGPARGDIEVALHMDNFAAWDVFKDPSNEGNIGAALPNDQIVLRDGRGEILWGEPITADRLAQTAKRTVTVVTREAAVGERNVSKTEIEIRNDGNVPLRNLKATWITRLPEGATALLERWNAGEATTMIEALGNGYWALTWNFPRWIQPHEKTVGGSVGIHLVTWPVWDRSGAPSRNGTDGTWSENPWVQVVADDGTVLWGNLPPLDSIRSIPADTSTIPDDTAVTRPNLRVELRDDAPQEQITMKPRVRVTNLGTEPVRTFTLSFPFQTERGLAAMGYLWYPTNCGLSVQTGATGKGTGTLRCADVSIAPGGVWPDPVGASLGFYHTDWSNWDKSNDPAFKNVGATFSEVPGVVVSP